MHMPIAFRSIESLVSDILDGQLSSEELVRTQLGRIAQLDPKLHAYVDVYRDEALAAAQALDRMARAGIKLGPLHGTTVAVKDLFDIAGKPLRAGSLATPPRMSTLTATVVSRLQSSGAVVLGKTHTVEYAFGGWGTNPSMGTPWNPWDLHTHRVPGGSSSGSAVAVAAGMSTASLGTDTGGSVRIPAGLCGLVGLKTTHGLVSRQGLAELCPSHDTVGPITRTVRDAALLLDVMAGPDADDPVTRQAPTRRALQGIEQPVEGMRAWILPTSERASTATEVLAAYDRSLELLARLDVVLVERELPQPLAESMRIAGSLMSAEGYASLGELFEQDLAFDPHVRRRILAGRQIDAAQYIELLRLRRHARDAMLDAMDGIDFCCFPTNAITAIPLSEVDETSTPLSRFGRFVNLLDLCSVAVPAGLSPAGLPVSVQFVGRPLQEPLILRAAHAFEKALGWVGTYPSGMD